MLVELKPEEYKEVFGNNLNPFISYPFIEHNAGKAEKLCFLADTHEKSSIGLIGGIRDKVLLSPFSAPFGGFHYKHETIHYSKIFEFVTDLKLYAQKSGIERIEIILPPDIYCQTFNAKVINALLRAGYKMLMPDLTSIGYLTTFTGHFSNHKSVKNYKKALKNGLVFFEATTMEEKKAAYDLVVHNRLWLNRPMSMTFSEVIEILNIWPVDFFIVSDKQNNNVASAIFYRSHPTITQAVWWGDNELGRSLRAMDYLCDKLWNHYKNMGYKYIDIGISSEEGVPNEGLLWFKEMLDAFTFLRCHFVFETFSNK